MAIENTAGRMGRLAGRKAVLAASAAALAAALLGTGMHARSGRPRRRACG